MRQLIRNSDQDMADPEAGFTLLELLVSLCVLGLTLALLPGAIQMGRRVWVTTDTLERLEERNAVAAYLQATISKALPVQRRDRDGGRRVAFRGEPDRMIFVAAAGEGMSSRGLLLYDLGARFGEGPTATLRLRWSPFRPGNRTETIAGPVREREMLGDITAFGLRYLGDQGSEGGRRWASTWTRTDALPEAVELRIATAGRDPHLRLAVELLPHGHQPLSKIGSTGRSSRLSDLVSQQTD